MQSIGARRVDCPSCRSLQRKGANGRNRQSTRNWHGGCCMKIATVNTRTLHTRRRRVKFCGVMRREKLDVLFLSVAHTLNGGRIRFGCGEDVSNRTGAIHTESLARNMLREVGVERHWTTTSCGKCLAPWRMSRPTPLHAVSTHETMQNGTGPPPSWPSRGRWRCEVAPRPSRERLGSCSRRQPAAE